MQIQESEKKQDRLCRSLSSEVFEKYLFPNQKLYAGVYGLFFLCYTFLVTQKDTPYDNLSNGWGEEPPAGSVPGETVIETPIGSEARTLEDPSLRSRIQKLEAAGKKVITEVGTGRVILIVVGGVLAAGIAVEEGIRRRRKHTTSPKRKR